MGQDSWDSGSLAAKLIEVPLIVSNAGDIKNQNHIRTRKEGFIQYFKDKYSKNTSLIYMEIDNFNDRVIYKSLEDIFIEHSKIEGIFVTNSSVFNVAQFLESENINNVKLIGYDLTAENIPYLENDYIDFLISQKPIEQGYKAVNSLFNHVIFKKTIPREILLSIDIVSKENLKYYQEYQSNT